MKDRREYFKAYYQANKPTDEMKEMLKIANREKVAAYNKAYREAHRPALGRKTVEAITKKQKSNRAYYLMTKAKKSV